ncbi:MAG: restriction endonuclease [Myxococcota bacterium]|nr:restriction endonuclease [Myxococcota bacterium]
MPNYRAERIRALCEALRELTDSQLSSVARVVTQFRAPMLKRWRNQDSDLVDNCLVRDFGDALRVHHCFSKEPLSKDRFEYALEKTLIFCGRNAALAERGNPGHDITIEDVPCSLKTQADRGIKEHEIRISKFMELGSGRWEMAALRDQLLRHMHSYERIFTLRCLAKPPTRPWRYELVEVPKRLLGEAARGSLAVCEDSRQSPQPGYCRVFDERGALRFQLYFDGGTERKLQIQKLRKSECIVHAEWEFAIDED